MARYKRRQAQINLHQAVQKAWYDLCSLWWTRRGLVAPEFIYDPQTPFTVSWELSLVLPGTVVEDFRTIYPNGTMTRETDGSRLPVYLKHAMSLR